MKFNVSQCFKTTLLVVFLIQGCDSDINDLSSDRTQEFDFNKETVRNLGKADSDAVAKMCRQLGQSPDCDICEASGWYNDGECDTFCDLVDPDCESSEGEPCGALTELICKEGLYCAGLTDFEEEPGTCLELGKCGELKDCLNPDNQEWIPDWTAVGHAECENGVCIWIMDVTPASGEGEPCGALTGLDCEEGLFCAGLSDFEEEPGTCLELGKCGELKDCLNPDNQEWIPDWTAVGHAECENGVCIWIMDVTPASGEGEPCGALTGLDCEEGLFCAGLSDFEEEPGICMQKGQCMDHVDCTNDDNLEWMPEGQLLLSCHYRCDVENTCQFESSISCKLNINQASVEQLSTLMGLWWSEQVVMYREENGPFESIWDLSSAGIPFWLILQNMELITVGDGA